jgi:hypothetical protein
MSALSSYQAAERFHEVARAAIAHWQFNLFIFCRLSNVEELELLVDVRRYPHVHARRVDRHRHRPGDALCPARRFRFRFRRTHHAAGGEKAVRHKITMSCLRALCGLALLVQHVAELGSNFTGDHLVAGALMLTAAVMV